MLALVILMGALELSPLRDYRVEIPADSQQLDLSGLLRLSEDLQQKFGLNTPWLLLNDKSSHVYTVAFPTSSGVVTPQSWIDLASFVSARQFDLEDLAAHQDSLFVVEETNGTLFQVTPPKSLLSPSRTPRINEITAPLPKKGPFQLSKFGGIEGLEVFEGQFYLAKELVPLAIFQTKLKGDHKLQKPRAIARSALGSQTAIRIRDGRAFILDREAHCVWEVPLEKLGSDTEEKCLSFEKTVKSKRFHYPVKDGEGRVRLEWGTAEALEITETEIWIGLDNNGLGLFSNPNEKRPSVIVFRRP